MTDGAPPDVAPEETPPPPPPEGVVVLPDEPLAAHMPLRIGGPCDAWVVVHRRDALVPTLAWCKARGWNRTLVGTGSRVVVRDGGLAGAVIRLGTGFGHVVDDGDAWWVGAAVPLSVVAARCGGALANRRDAGGSVGASLALDDGWDPWVDRVRYVHRGGEREAVFADLSSRSRVLFTEARIWKSAEGPAPGPILPGSWFAPMEDDVAADLLADAALSAARLRGVCLPAAAPDRLVNVGSGNARDAQMLLKSVIERVHQARGVKLQDRMMWWGRVS